MIDTQLFNGSEPLGVGGAEQGADSATTPAASMDDAIARFGTWFSQAHAEGGIDMASPGVMHVLPPLGNRFCLGLWGYRFYIAVPPDAEEWVTKLPISHVIADVEKSAVSMHCEHTSGRTKALPAFTLTFEVGTRDYVAMLATHSFLDVRVAEVNPASAEGFDVSRQVLLSLPIQMVGNGSLGVRNRIAPGAAHPHAPSPDPSSKSSLANRRI